MATRALRTEEIVGLGAAVVLHLGLAAILVMRPNAEPTPPPIERVTVSLANDVGLEAASPTPVMESRAAIAPTLSDEPAPPSPVEPAVAAPAAVSPPVATRPPPRRNATRANRRTAPATRQPPRRRPEKPASKPAPPKPPAATRRSGGSRIGANFLPGSGDSTTTEQTRAPARNFGAREQAALGSAINRQLKPHWRAPQGVDTERLVTVLSWRMNADGSLAGTPKVVRQTGINDSNRAQAQVHAERAIRAVQLAAPFNLPDDFYDKWKFIRDWRFDRRL